MQDSARLSIHYEGQLQQIDVEILIASLLNLAEVTRTVAADVAGDAPIQVKATAPERGSFVIDLEMIRKTGELLAGSVGPQIPTIVRMILDILHIKQLLKGEQPDSVVTDGDTVIIVKGDAHLEISRNVYTYHTEKPNVDAGLSRIFERMVENPEIESVSIEAPNIGKFQAENKDFAAMARHSEVAPDTGKVTVSAELVVTKLVFERGRRWEFVYQGNKISAVIEDDAFWSQVDSRAERFAKGDRLEVTLEISRVYDEMANCWLNKSYKVLSVKGHHLGPDQLKLPGLKW